MFQVNNRLAPQCIRSRKMCAKFFYQEACEREANRLMILKTLARKLQKRCLQTLSERLLWSKIIRKIDERRSILQTRAKEAPSVVDEMIKGRPAQNRP